MLSSQNVKAVKAAIASLYDVCDHSKGVFTIKRAYSAPTKPDVVDYTNQLSDTLTTAGFVTEILGSVNNYDAKAQKGKYQVRISATVIGGEIKLPETPLPTAPWTAPPGKQSITETSLIPSEIIMEALKIITAAGIVATDSGKIGCQIVDRTDKPEIDIYYEYYFRRNTAAGAFAETKLLWLARDRMLSSVAENDFIKKHFDVELTTMGSAPEFYVDPSDENDGYSEYEQSIGTSLLLKLRQS